MTVHAETKAAAARRAARMLAAWRKGKSYRQLGEEEGITPGRVREIVSRGKMEERNSKIRPRLVMVTNRQRKK